MGKIATIDNQVIRGIGRTFMIIKKFEEKNFKNTLFTITSILTY